MRSRNIKPGFYKNDLLAECDPLARILFTGLWCMADREGRLEYRSKKIKAELLPYDTCNIEKLIKQLSDKKFITIYAVNNENYIEISAFLKHQTPHIKEQASTIPAPDKNQTSISVESLIPDSLNLIPDSGLLNADAPDKSGAKTLPQKTKYLDSVFLSEPEYTKLQEAIGQKSLELGIEKLDYSITVKGGKYKNHYKVLLNWFKRGFLNENGSGVVKHQGIKAWLDEKQSEVVNANG
jgi:uncharacterized protein YlbG (UPF0298 family)